MVEINDGSDSPKGRALSSTSYTGVWLVVYDGSGHPEITTKTITDLETGKTYHFRYTALNANGASDISSVYSFPSCVDPTPPG